MSTVAATAPVVARKAVAVPNEHGGWGMLAEPLLLGLVVAPTVAGGGLALAAVAAFLLRHPLKIALSDWRRNTRYPRTAVAAVFSVMRNVSVPIGIKIPGQPNIADTLWLTVSDQKNKVYFYQSTNSPSIIWAKLNELDFKEGSGPRRLQLDGFPDTAGDQTQNFKPAELFKFMAPAE